ncbi:MAG: cyclic-di-AMP receptor [Thermoflexales bacterium]|nr:cyclic-di-AMP receptor [Thermoflexales bacterium]
MTQYATVNQLLIATVSSSQTGTLMDKLTRDGFYVTRVDSSGGILYEATVSLFIGLNQSRLPRLLEHLRECCPTRRRLIPAHIEAPLLEVQPVMIEAEVGGAMIYVLDIERFEQV